MEWKATKSTPGRSHWKEVETEKRAEERPKLNIPKEKPQKDEEGTEIETPDGKPHGRGGGRTPEKKRPTGRGEQDRRKRREKQKATNVKEPKKKKKKKKSHVQDKEGEEAQKTEKVTAPAKGRAPLRREPVIRPRQKSAQRPTGKPRT